MFLRENNLRSPDDDDDSTTTTTFNLTSKFTSNVVVSKLSTIFPDIRDGHSTKSPEINNEMLSSLHDITNQEWNHHAMMTTNILSFLIEQNLDDQLLATADQRFEEELPHSNDLQRSLNNHHDKIPLMVVDDSDITTTLPGGGGSSSTTTTSLGKNHPFQKTQQRQQRSDIIEQQQQQSSLNHQTTIHPRWLFTGSTCTPNQSTISDFDLIDSKKPKKKCKAYRYTKPGETTYTSPELMAILPCLASEALAPLHIILPVSFPYGKILIASAAATPNNVPSPSSKEHPLHHYYFKQQYPSANTLFSRLHGICNQNPGWLALDVGYLACREHQVAYAVELFTNFFRRGLQEIAITRRKQQRKAKMMTDAEHNKFLGSDSTAAIMAPIKLRCSGLRLREDHGSGWYLYETPVETCSDTDTTNFRAIIKLIEQFNIHVRQSRLCQNATMKPFLNGQFAIVVLKQERSGICPMELEKIKNFRCEGIEMSEIRLVRHKLLDIFGNATFERDPRFGICDIYCRPIAHNKVGRHGRVVFAKTQLPEVLVRSTHSIHPAMSDLEEDSEESDDSHGENM